MHIIDGIEHLFVVWREDRFPYRIKSALSIKVPLI